MHLPTISQDFPGIPPIPPLPPLFSSFISFRLERLERIEEALQRKGFGVANLRLEVGKRLELCSLEYPFLGAVNKLAALDEAEFPKDLSNLHLVGTGLPLDRFGDGFGQKEFGGDGLADVLG